MKTDMDAKEVWKALEEFEFLTVLSNQFMDEKKLCFRTRAEAEDFMIKFLVNECISGSNSDEDLMRAYEIIQKWVSEGRSIYSENLPIGRHKTHEQKSLRNVEYFIYMNNVFARPLAS